MSSSRVSFGSRAGGAFDYPGGQNEVIIRSSTHSGAYDTLAALTDALKNDFTAAAESAEPQCTTLELSLSPDVILELVRPGVGPYADGGDHDLPPQFKQVEEEDVDMDVEVNAEGNDNAAPANRTRLPRATVGSIVNIPDERQSAIVQRAASRGVIAAIEKTDGFRYSFNNAWNAKDGEGSRFSYICQDSMQNKDRHANGYTRTMKTLKGDVGLGSRGPRKPTYDCKGSVSIKFSTTKQRCDVYYRHYAIHPTVADRARPAAVRRPFVSRGRMVPNPDGSQAGVGSGGLLATLQAETYANSALAMVDRSESSNIGRPMKRKRESGPAAPPRNDPSKPLSLVELLSQSESAKAVSPVNESNTRQGKSQHPAPIAYDVPSWQTPPPPRPTGAPAGYVPPYQPPYQPTKNRAPSTPSITQPQQPAFKQKSSGHPTGSHPQAQGLFATLKPISAITHQSIPGTMYGPSPATYQNPAPAAPESYEVLPRWKRVKFSCVRCRAGKKRCDEGRPCTSCMKSGLGVHDCIYEGVAPRGTDPTSYTPGGNRMPWTAHDRPSPMAGNYAATYSHSSAATPPVQHLPWEMPVSQTGSTPDVSSTAWRPPAANMGGTQREASPDPWFPRR